MSRSRILCLSRCPQAHLYGIQWDSGWEESSLATFPDFGVLHVEHQIRHETTYKLLTFTQLAVIPHSRVRLCHTFHNRLNLMFHVERQITETKSSFAYSHKPCGNPHSRGWPCHTIHDVEFFCGKSMICTVFAHDLH